MSERAPVLLAVEGDGAARAAVERELRKRYATDYEILCAEEGEAALERLAAERRDVAVVLTASSGAEDLLARCRQLHPDARRALLIGPDDTDPTAFRRALALGLAHALVPKPLDPVNEQFHQGVVDFLAEWTRERGAVPLRVEVVGERWAPRSHELRDILSRASIPHRFLEARSPAGRARLGELGVPDGCLPVTVVGGSVLLDPTNEELAVALGGNVDPEGGVFDVVVVGAGPAGLGAAVYAASEGLRVLVLDEGPFGGQAGTSSMIRNYLGFPYGVSGSELARRAYVQAVLFGAEFAFGREVVEVRREEGLLALRLAGDGVVRAHAVILATGVAWRRLGVPELEERVGAGVFYGAAASEAPAFGGRDVFVVGGGNSAGQAALHLARFARRVTVLVRGASLEASMSAYLIRQLEAAPNVDVRLRTVAAGGEGRGVLERLVLEERETGARELVPASALFVLIGAEPGTDWLGADVARDDRGYVVTGRDVGDAWPLDREPLLLETSLPGLFAAGDVRAGSAKRVAAAVGEGALAIQLCHRYLAAEAAATAGS